MKDPNYWDDPESFKPERFLDEGGQKLKREERMVAFGIGKKSISSVLGATSIHT
jgi:cytochrome P450